MGISGKYKYVFARELKKENSPAGLIAIVVRENGSDSFYYTYTDHLGSILTVTNSSGGIVAEQSFDAWGRRRNPATWVPYASATEAGTLPVWLYRGYTGHEQLDRFGLINMNGRLYDPTLGRVLSPDNYVQEPFNTQSFNRYSYAFNNPLKYSDPSGQLFILDNLILGAVGGLFNLVTNLGTIQNGWQALGYFSVGFASGFVAGYGQIAVSGAILAAGNAALGGASPGQIALSAVTGAATSVIGAQLGGALTPYLNNMATGIASPVLRQGLTNLVAGGTVGGLIGGGVAALSGNNILSGIGSGAQMGALSGGLNGVAGGLIQAGRNGVNPWTGKLRTDFSTTEFPSGNSYSIPHESMGVTANGNSGGYFPSNINWGSQDKHIIGRNNYILGRSILDADPQALLHGVNSGQYNILRRNQNNVIVDFGHDIGIYYQQGSPAGRTNYGAIHFGQKGAHIVPANPLQIQRQ